MIPKWINDHLRWARLNADRVDEDYQELGRTQFGRRVIADLLWNFDYGRPSFTETSRTDEAGGFVKEGQKSVLEYLLDKVEPYQPVGEEAKEQEEAEGEGEG